MHRFTITFVTIFCVLNQLNPVIAQGFGALDQNESKIEKREKRQKRAVEASEVMNSSQKVSEESLESHSRSKRWTWGGLASKVGGAVVGGSVLASLGVTIFTEIDKCKSYEPTYADCDDDKSDFTCEYVECANVCQGPDDNDKVIRDTKDDIQTLLTEMDSTVQKVFYLATESAAASVMNDAILQKIEAINSNADRLIDKLERLDRNITYKFVATRNEIKALLLDYSFSVDDITGTGVMEGIFDKWTWEGTGAFVLSLALPIGVKGFKYFRKRLAVKKLYTNLKTDFVNRMVANSGIQGRAGQKMTRDLWISVISQPKVDAQLKVSAKALYESQKAAAKPNKLGIIMNVFVNLAVIALSVYTTWMLIDACVELANEMYRDAKNISIQHDEIAKIKQVDLDPLWIQTQEEAWAPVKNLLTNDTVLEMLDDIRNLTLNAENVNTTTANTIQDFIENIGEHDSSAAGYNYKTDVEDTKNLQERLLEALSSISYKYDCYGDKIHAINTLLEYCEAGDYSFETLYYNVAVQKNELNRDDCVSDDMIPYTSQEEFWTILQAFAEHNGFYSNCLLNSPDLLYRVCQESLNGYTDSQIVTQVNDTEVTLDMVTNFLARCPDPEITPAGIDNTCAYYCSNLAVSDIAKNVKLKESQVESIIETCPICDVTKNEVTDICYLYYCKLEDVTHIVGEEKLPSATIEWVIANNCSKCIIKVKDVLQKICDQNMCKAIAAVDLAADLGYPEYAIDDVIDQCGTILPDGCGDVSENDIMKVKTLYCSGSSFKDAAAIAVFVELPIETIQRIIDELTCP